jgi:hypothetical protein
MHCSLYYVEYTSLSVSKCTTGCRSLGTRFRIPLVSDRGLLGLYQFEERHSATLYRGYVWTAIEYALRLSQGYSTLFAYKIGKAISGTVYRNSKEEINQRCIEKSSRICVSHFRSPTYLSCVTLIYLLLSLFLYVSFRCFHQLG